MHSLADAIAISARDGTKEAMGKRACVNCLFWESFDGGDPNSPGWCYRYPPTNSQDDKEELDREQRDLDWWPRVESFNWCGEWRAKDVTILGTGITAKEIMDNLDVSDIRRRLGEIEGEQKALRVLLRSAIQRSRGQATTAAELKSSISGTKPPK